MAITGRVFILEHETGERVYADPQAIHEEAYQMVVRTQARLTDDGTTSPDALVENLARSAEALLLDPNTPEETIRNTKKRTMEFYATPQESEAEGLPADIYPYFKWSCDMCMDKDEEGNKLSSIVGQGPTPLDAFCMGILVVYHAKLTEWYMQQEQELIGEFVSFGEFEPSAGYEDVKA